MNNKLRKVLLAILIIIFVVSAAKLGMTLLEYQEGEDIYDAAVTEYVVPATLPETTDAAVEIPSGPPDIDFKALESINKDAVGWIWIEDSHISYPVVQGRDNARYLTRTYDGKYNILGSIFVDYRIPGDFSARNTVVYGHNMKNDAMFGTLEKYREWEYYEDHRFVYILTEGKALKYKVFSAYVTDAYGDSYTMNFNSDAAYANYIQKMKSNSMLDTGVEVSGEDQIITLSTCTNSTRKTERFVIHAKLI